MTKWLASVQSLEEAQALTHSLPDILDLKNPSAGALGALSAATVAEIADWVSGRCLTSATVGDLPMQAPVIAEAVQSMSLSAVDYIKVGLFDAQNLTVCLHELTPHLARIDKPVIAVIFADQAPRLSLLPLIKQAGFVGVMVDTAEKNGRGLLDHWPVSRIREFVAKARELEMICGLAGALRLEDIDSLDGLGADYLGFRSALCHQHQRNTALQPERAHMIQQRLLQLSLAS